MMLILYNRLSSFIYIPYLMMLILIWVISVKYYSVSITINHFLTYDYSKHSFIVYWFMFVIDSRHHSILG